MWLIRNTRVIPREYTIKIAFVGVHDENYSKLRILFRRNIDYVLKMRKLSLKDGWMIKVLIYMMFSGCVFLLILKTALSTSSVLRFGANGASPCGVMAIERGTNSYVKRLSLGDVRLGSVYLLSRSAILRKYVVLMMWLFIPVLYY